ncbi:hypothetical protein KCU62_g405, partial [Aureobasidium sp. EXF-3399]
MSGLAFGELLLLRIPVEFEKQNPGETKIIPPPNAHTRYLYIFPFPFPCVSVAPAAAAAAAASACTESPSLLSDTTTAPESSTTANVLAPLKKVSQTFCPPGTKAKQMGWRLSNPLGVICTSSTNGLVASSVPKLTTRTNCTAAADDEDRVGGYEGEREWRGRAEIGVDDEDGCVRQVADR